MSCDTITRGRCGVSSGGVVRDEREAQEPMAAGAAEWLIHVQSTADAASTSPGSLPLIQLAMRGQFPGHSAGRSEWIHRFEMPFFTIKCVAHTRQSTSFA